MRGFHQAGILFIGHFDKINLFFFYKIPLDASSPSAPALAHIFFGLETENQGFGSHTPLVNMTSTEVFSIEIMTDIIKQLKNIPIDKVAELGPGNNC